MHKKFQNKNLSKRFKAMVTVADVSKTTSPKPTDILDYNDRAFGILPPGLQKNWVALEQLKTEKLESQADITELEIRFWKKVRKHFPGATNIRRDWIVVSKGRVCQIVVTFLGF